MLKKLFAHPPNTVGFNLPENFILKFIFLEASVRLVGSYYRDRTTKKKKQNTHEPLNIAVVQRSFKYFNINVSDELLDLVLKSESIKRNSKSARNLRNGLAHHWKAEDVKEVKDRYDFLDNTLTKVINAIRARVESQT